MTFSEVNVQKAEAENYVNNIRVGLRAWKTNINESINKLIAINSRYSALAAEINSFTPTGEWETECKEWLTRILAERNLLQSEVETCQSFLATLTEF